VFGLLAAAIVLLVASVTLVIARSRLERALDRQLVSTATSFQKGPAARVRRPGQLAAATRNWLAEHPLPQGQMAAVRLPDGRVLTSAGGLDLFEIGRPQALLRATRTQWWKLHSEEGAVRGLTEPIRARHRQLGTLVLLAYERPMQQTMRAILSGIALASAVGLLAALLLGFAVVRRSLRPLRRMAAGVEEIETAPDLSRRLRLDGEGPADEVGRLAQSFDSLLGRLEASFDKQRRFLADASHELRTPLTVARGQLELLAADVRGDAGGPFAQASAELERMSRIVDDLLLLARLDEGLELESVPVELELVLRETQLRAMLLGSCDIRVEAESELYALADPVGITQVVTNLATNAVKHIPENGHVTLSAKRLDRKAVIEVSDDGSGIPERELAHVFERFYRGAKERALCPDGSGLGLAIADSVVAAMGGTIEVDSIPNAMTTFTVTLPLA
jgi:signal transduction histidine kinase